MAFPDRFPKVTVISGPESVNLSLYLQRPEGFGDIDADIPLQVTPYILSTIFNLASVSLIGPRGETIEVGRDGKYPLPWNKYSGSVLKAVGDPLPTPADRNRAIQRQERQRNLVRTLGHDLRKFDESYSNWKMKIEQRAKATTLKNPSAKPQVTIVASPPAAIPATPVPLDPRDIPRPNMGGARPPPSRSSASVTSKPARPVAPNLSRPAAASKPTSVSGSVSRPSATATVGVVNPPAAPTASPSASVTRSGLVRQPDVATSVSHPASRHPASVSRSPGQDSSLAPHSAFPPTPAPSARTSPSSSSVGHGSDSSTAQAAHARRIGASTRDSGECPHCGQSMSKSMLAAHVTACPASRPSRTASGAAAPSRARNDPAPALVVCSYCHMHIPHGEAEAHEQQCVSRSERCGTCRQRVPLRDMARHQASCGREHRQAPQPSPTASQRSYTTATPVASERSQKPASNSGVQPPSVKPPRDVQYNPMLRVADPAATHGDGHPGLRAPVLSRPRGDGDEPRTTLSRQDSASGTPSQASVTRKYSSSSGKQHADNRPTLHDELRREQIQASEELARQLEQQEYGTLTSSDERLAQTLYEQEMRRSSQAEKDTKLARRMQKEDTTPGRRPSGSSRRPGPGSSSKHDY